MAKAKKTKLKTNKTASKRFKVTATGKIMRRHSHNNHMFFSKSASRKRRLDQEVEVTGKDAKRMRKLLAL